MEGFSCDPLPSDEDAERAGVHGLCGLGLGLILVLLVAGRSRQRTEREEEAADQSSADESPACSGLQLHSASPCSVRIAIFRRPSFSAISAAIAFTVRLPVSIFTLAFM